MKAQKFTWQHGSRASLAAGALWRTGDARSALRRRRLAGGDRRQRLLLLLFSGPPASRREGSGRPAHSKRSGAEGGGEAGAAALGRGRRQQGCRLRLCRRTGALRWRRL